MLYDEKPGHSINLDESRSRRPNTLYAAVVRIGTWNLEGTWSADHSRAMTEIGADLWLLTEVRPRVALDGYGQHVTRSVRADGSHWAGVLARGSIDPLPDPHPASAAAWIDGLLACCSMLPWPFPDADTPWGDQASHLEAMHATLTPIENMLKGNPSVWGGTWHQPLAGNIVGFSPRVQEELLGTVELLGLQVPTARERTRYGRGQLTIDHLAVPAGWPVADHGSFVVEESSEHDAYWIEVDRP